MINTDKSPQVGHFSSNSALDLSHLAPSVKPRSACSHLVWPFYIWSSFIDNRKADVTWPNSYENLKAKYLYVLILGLTNYVLKIKKWPYLRVLA